MSYKNKILLLPIDIKESCLRFLLQMAYHSGMDNITLIPLEERFYLDSLAISNEIIFEGEAFPWDTPLTEDDLRTLYAPEDAIWCAVRGDELLGFVHIHANGVGRVGHIANFGFNVKKAARGQGVGRMLLEKALEVAQAMGFRGVQFNAVVATNLAAIRLYEQYDFAIIGVVPEGFRLGGAGSDAPARYVDRYIMYRELGG